MERELFYYEGFEWDQGNYNKNWLKHSIKPSESEEIFSNQPLLINLDNKHSQQEQRYISSGKTDSGKLLCVVFTTRGKNIRVISARLMSKKERMIYEKA